MPAALRILVVCTANICRSPATATLLRRQLPPQLGGVPLIVESAGIAALDGSPACDLASALVGEYVTRQYAGMPIPEPVEGSATLIGPSTLRPAQGRPSSGNRGGFANDGRSGDGVSAKTGGSGNGWNGGDRPHASRRVTAELATTADLILALDRTHRTALARLAPSARPRTFTLRQAARLATSVHQSLTAGMLPPGAPPLPEDPASRFRWLVGELDAALAAPPARRQPGDAGTALTPAQAHARQVAGWSWHYDDVPDPHVLGYQLHAISVASLQVAATQLSEVIVTLRATERSGPPAGNP